MADDCLGDIAALEKSFVEQGYREGFHIFAHAGHQSQAPAQQFFRQFFADIALVAEQLADKTLGQRGHRSRIADIARGQFERDDLTPMIEHQMQLEAEKPAHAGFSPSGQTRKNPVFGDPPVVTDRESGTVDVIDVGFLSHTAGQKKSQQSPHSFGERDEAFIAGRMPKIRAQELKNDAIVERLEVLELRTVIEHHKRHDFAVAKTGLRSMLAVRRVTIGHKIGLPLRPDLLAKVVKFAKSLHKPIEHPGLHTSCWFGSLESLKIHKMLIPSNPVTRVRLERATDLTKIVTTVVLVWLTGAAAVPDLTLIIFVDAH